VNRLQKDGTYKGRAVAWSVRKLSTGSVAIRVEFEVFERRDADGAWRKGQSALVVGDFFVLKQTGAANEKIAAMLCETIGWGGTFTETTETPPLDAIVQVDVESRQYNGKDYFDAKWIRQENDDRKAKKGDEPLGAVAVVELDKKHAAELKAIAAKAKKAAPPIDDGIPF
jgi:hypothetical protein